MFSTTIILKSQLHFWMPVMKWLFLRIRSFLLTGCIMYYIVQTWWVHQRTWGVGCWPAPGLWTGASSAPRTSCWFLFSLSPAVRECPRSRQPVNIRGITLNQWNYVNLSVSPRHLFSVAKDPGDLGPYFF